MREPFPGPTLPGACCSDCGNYHDGPSAGCVLFDAYVFEAGYLALSDEGLGLLIRPPMAGEPGGAGTHLPFDREESPSRGEHPSGLGEPRGDVLPVVDGGQ